MDSLQDDYRAGRDLALKRLGRRECTAKDIERHLLSKGVSTEVALRVVADLVSATYISDERYSKMLVREQAQRGKGPRVILQKLKEKGVKIELEQVKVLSQELGITSELEAARAILERKYPTALSDRKVANRAFQALLRRGFSYGVIRELIHP